MKILSTMLATVAAALLFTSCEADRLGDEPIVGEWKVTQYQRYEADASSPGALPTGSGSATVAENPDCTFVFGSDGTGGVISIARTDDLYGPAQAKDEVSNEYETRKFNWSIIDRTLLLDYTAGDPFLGGTQYDIEIDGDRMTMHHESAPGAERKLAISIACRRISEKIQ